MSRKSGRSTHPSWRLPSHLAARDAWAKYSGDSDETISLAQHLEDAGGVAGCLWDCWLPRHIRSQIADVAGGEAAGRRLVVWLAALHDVGKLSPAFADKIARTAPSVLSRMRDRGLRYNPVSADSANAPHGLVGQFVLNEWLANMYGATKQQANTLTAIIGGHHGRPPSMDQLGDIGRRSGPLGDRAWRDARIELLDAVTTATGADEHLAQWLAKPPPPTVQILLAAIVIAADWIASDSTKFRYGEITNDRLSRALEELGLPGPWVPSADAPPEEVFVQRFPQVGGDPNPMQRALVEAANDAAYAPLIIVESPTGSGKTEGMFLAAEVLARRFGSGGVFVGLPTMATSNAIFPRVLSWVGHGAADADVSTVLAHGKARLNPLFAELISGAEPRGIEADSGIGAAVVTSWFLGTKRALLASLVVGTIDQLLLGALKSKHVVLRHLALAGKVVVIDEVHAADVVMQVFLERMLEWLGAYGTPVILMSATLPPQQRAGLIDAYALGRLGRLGARPSRDVPISDEYPRITVWDGTLRTTSTAADPAFDRTVSVRSLDVPVADLLRDLLVDGGCAAVIRNTVTRAQQTYVDLREVFGADVALVHSRFLTCDRLVIEEHLTAELGPRGRRPHRRIVVATQVAEQSIDIDFDVMITDLAPVDLLLQRIGRLHRHNRPVERPDRLAHPTCFLDGLDDWTGAVPRLEPGGRRVYSDGPLLRAAIVMSPHVQGQPLRLPMDVPRLVRAAYDGDLDPPVGWEVALKDADAKAYAYRQDRKEQSKGYRLRGPDECPDLMGLVDVDVPVRDDVAVARVRDGEDGLEVIVLRRRENRSLRVLPHLGEFAERPLWPDHLPDRDVARFMRSCAVTLPGWIVGVRDAGGGIFDDLITVLERDGHAAWQQSPLLSGQLFLVLDESGVRRIGNHLFRYEREIGLTIEGVSP